MRQKLSHSEYMQERLTTMLKYGLEEKLSSLEFVESDNGFYLGEFKNGNRNGFGVYLWYNDAPPTHTIQ